MNKVKINGKQDYVPLQVGDMLKWLHSDDVYMITDIDTDNNKHELLNLRTGRTHYNIRMPLSAIERVPSVTITKE